MVERAPASASGKVAPTMVRTYCEMASVAATRSSLVGSQGSANIARNRAGCSSANRT